MRCSMTIKSSLKLALKASGACLALTLSSQAFASDFGCKALLCFAGGKGVSECQPTIKKVIRDMAKGKGFPHCSLVGGGSSSSGAIGLGESGTTKNLTDSMITVKRYTETQRRGGMCKDGETQARRIFNSYYVCPTIEINIPPEYSADEKHQKQIYNYQL